MIVTISLFLMAIGVLFVIPIPEPMEKALLFLTKGLSSAKHTQVQFACNDAESSYYYENSSSYTSSVQIPPSSYGQNSFAIYENTAEAERKNSEESSSLPSSVTVLSNETAYSPDISVLLSEYIPQKISVNESSDNSVTVFSSGEHQSFAPSVLIIHTHGTEGYRDSAKTNYRTTEAERNVVAVGKRLAENLNEKGIPTLHCTRMFDEKSYINAYSYSYSEVSEYLSKYPSIKYVIDVHRDAIPDPNGGYAKLVAEKDGTVFAQLMIVVGTNEAGAKHPTWIENLACAANLQKKICDTHPTLMRNINLRRASFNQQLCPGYFILEAGNCSATLEEVFNSIDVFADCFVRTVT